ncbi:hypothetical protein VNO77_02735 [Canavalia gladiata]|uniref:Uncharacterized protein n=1 Tax=Canavalia gladiata TaxID=3824 RepID=A0AAN9R6D0_CANGL
MLLTVTLFLFSMVIAAVNSVSRVAHGLLVHPIDQYLKLLKSDHIIVKVAINLVLWKKDCGATPCWWERLLASEESSASVASPPIGVSKVYMHNMVMERGLVIGSEKV